MLKTLALAFLVFSGLLALACEGDSSPAPTTNAQSAAETLNRGLRAHAEGRLNEATTMYHEVLVQEPTNKYAFYNLGLIQHTTGALSAAEGYYRLALNTDPDYVPALYNLALVRASMDGDQEAIGLLRHAIAIEPNNAPAHMYLGILLLAMGQQSEGDTEIARALELDSTLQVPTPFP